MKKIKDLYEKNKKTFLIVGGLLIALGVYKIFKKK